MRDALLVALGAVPGAWLRFRIVNHLEPLLPRRHWGTFGVNVIACFALGLLSVLLSRCAGADNRLMLLLGTGFLGGLSAEKYIKMTGVSKATATRDLVQMVEQSLLRAAGEGKARRYYLEVPDWTHGL